MNQINARIAALLERKPVILQLLRFAAIGALNTALDFIILNYVTKSLDVTSGVALGALNIISFTAAIIQSYLWNRAWTFSQTSGSPLQNAYRLVLVGGLGFAAFVATVLGAAYGAVPVYYLIILAAFIISEVSLWILFGLSAAKNSESIGHQFVSFLIVSVVGLLINSVIIAIASYFLAPRLEEYVNADTVKNIAKAMATGVSLIWNFLGYKMIVFRK